MRTTRDRLIAAAGELLDQGGPEAVTLREVGRMAGVSHNAPYKHFTDKSALLAAVAARELRVLVRRLQQARRRAPDDLAALRAAAHTYVRWATAHPIRFRLTFSGFDTDDADLDEAASEARREFFRPFAAAARTGALRRVEPDRAALLVWTLAHGAVDLDLTGHLRKDGSRATPETLVANLVALLVAPPE